MLRTTLAVLLASIVITAHAQQSNGSNAFPNDDEPRVVTERGTATEVAPGITVIIDPISTSPLVVANEIHYFPHFVEQFIAYDQDYVTFVLEVASRVTTRVFIESSDPENLVSRSAEVIVPAGSRVSAGFAAFAPHSGVISLYNEEMDLLAEVPYNIVKQSRLQHTLTGYATTSMATDFTDAAFSPTSVGVGYGISERSSGIGATVSFEYSTDGTLNAQGTISGSHTW